MIACRQCILPPLVAMVFMLLAVGIVIIQISPKRSLRVHAPNHIQNQFAQWTFHWDSESAISFLSLESMNAGLTELLDDPELDGVLILLCIDSGLVITSVFRTESTSSTILHHSYPCQVIS